ncbi:MAG: deoxyribodipyrimidine photo-lyase [Thermodesulfobacteriota bacterium]|nr:MAG: deoxyribodipyrimidine photo-lyase [Thermodesulfobacteriota bacterium]
MFEGRYETLKDGALRKGPVAYWMSRDQRSKDNWALLFAQSLAIERKAQLIVLFCLAPAFLGAALRQYGFMLRGLKEVEESLAERSVPFVLIKGEPPIAVPDFIKRYEISELVTDFDPLKIKRGWRDAVAARIGIPFHMVDAHNIVPCRIASSKQEFAARTFRPRIQARLKDFLTDFPRFRRHPHHAGIKAGFELEKTISELEIDSTVKEADWIKPGESEARKALESFIVKKLGRYADDRNDPTKDGQSNLSPYLHFGQISAQRVALQVMRKGADGEGKKAFLEELIVRKELSDNFCLYNRDYDSARGFPAWAKKTLDAHSADRREFLFSLDELENARTYDPLWNASQMQMVKTGKMHGYMRMYWAKKMLEWSGSPEAALRNAIYLNDKYELDGRDPNGYAGIAWAIGGVHDRAWAERKVTGKIRFMSYKGSRSKFDVDAYIRRWGG